MFIIPISKMPEVGSLEKFGTVEASGEAESGGQSFKDIFAEAVQEAEENTQRADAEDIKLTEGGVDDLHTAMIQAEQAQLSVEYTTQLLSRAVGAYNQIMGMQV